MKPGLVIIPHVLFAVTSIGCNVPRPPGSTGGTTIPSEGACGRGFVILESQYQSTNVALMNFRGEVLTQSLASSASGGHGLYPALSGDVVPSSGVCAGDQLVLVDRASEGSRLTFLRLDTGDIAKVVAVDTGFPSFPQDYVQVSTDKGYVSRFAHNQAPGQAPFDQGSDVLIVNPAEDAVLDRIDLRPLLTDDARANLPRPNRMAVVGQRAFVLLGVLPVKDFVATTSSRLAVIDTLSDEIESTIVLSGLRNCNGLAVSPDQKELAIFCSALTDASGGSDLASSGIAIVDASDTVRLERVIPADVFGGVPIGFAGDFASVHTLLFTTFGSLEGNAVIRSDQLLKIDLLTDSVQSLVQANPFSLGGVACAASCGVCMVADAETDGGVVRRYTIDDAGMIESEGVVKVETTIGLPPRYIGRF